MTRTELHRIDTLIHARWVVPIRPAKQVLEDHAVAILNDQIVAVLPSEEAHTRFHATRSFRLDHHVLMPGLVNAHGHAAMALFRGLADDLPLMPWLTDHIWPAEGQWVDRAFAEDGVRLAMAEMVKSGTTCFSDMYFFPDVTAQLAAEQKVRCQVAFPVLDFPTVWAKDAEEYIHKGLQLRDDVKGSDFVSVAFGPHAPYTVSDEPLQQIATLAAQLDMPIQMHVHETQHEVDEALAKTGKRPLARLRELDLLSPQFQAVHMTALNDEDLAIAAESGLSVVHCPESNLKLASGFCPTARLSDAGVNLALGTDGAASNNDLDLFAELRTAVLIGKQVAGDATALPAHQALEMVTLGGARCLGLDDKLGSLEAGKWADMIAIDIHRLNSQPLYDAASQIVYCGHGSQVSHSWIGGRLHVEDHRLVHVDEQRILHQASQWAQRIVHTTN